MGNPFVAQALDNVRSAPPNIQFLDTTTPSDTAPDAIQWAVKKDPRSGSLITDSHLRIKLISRSDEPQSPSQFYSSNLGPDGKSNIGKRVEAIHPDVFALGDCGIIENTSYPATAQVASQKAVWLAKQLNNQATASSSRQSSLIQSSLKLSSSSPDGKGFTYKNLGTLAYIGSWNALFQGGGGGRLQGFLAWLVWRGAYITRTVSWRNKILVPVYW